MNDFTSYTSYMAGLVIFTTNSKIYVLALIIVTPVITYSDIPSTKLFDRFGK